MARQLIIEIWCDECIRTDDTNHTAGDEFTVAINGGVPRTIALCPDHAGSILAPLAVLLESAPNATAHESAKAHGRKAAAAADTLPGLPGAVAQRSAGKGSPWVCPYGDGFHVGARSTLGKHLKSVHETDVITAREQFPEWAAGLPTKVQHHTASPSYRRRECPEPGCDFYTMTAQGFTMHLKAHDTITPAERERILTEERTRAIGA